MKHHTSRIIATLLITSLLGNDRRALALPSIPSLKPATPSDRSILLEQAIPGANVWARLPFSMHTRDNQLVPASAGFTGPGNQDGASPTTSLRCGGRVFFWESEHRSLQGGGSEPTGTFSWRFVCRGKQMTGV
jgi:hypothetical protein